MQRQQRPEQAPLPLPAPAPVGPVVVERALGVVVKRKVSPLGVAPERGVVVVARTDDVPGRLSGDCSPVVGGKERRKERQCGQETKERETRW